MKFRELEIGDLFTTTLDGFGVKQKLNNKSLHNYVQVVKGVNSMKSGLFGDYSRDGNVRKVKVKDDAFSIEERLTLGDLQVGQYFKEDSPDYPVDYGYGNHVRCKISEDTYARLRHSDAVLYKSDGIDGMPSSTHVVLVDKDGNKL